ncbi:MAG: RsmB/NOP family class I SAM-dependent RNA methyltransferase [Promethearchaeota archaeon]|nr:MAG: RsmB/NOP family class I SAM-dependent RNA methyltransferase [Candidatus Lokiarchaeota archaeon]
MIERYIEFLGMDGTIKLLQANERPLIPSIRVNTLKMKPNELKARLENKHFILEPLEWVPYGFKVLKVASNLGSLHEYLQGFYYLQNLASMMPPLILNPKSNEVIIDMCAAPGSKATQLAQIMDNGGCLILIDKNMSRIPALEMNVRRMGVYNSIIINHDAINLPELDIKADKILLDVPCTGEGLIREDASRKKSKTIQDIKKMAKIQKKLLKAGLDTLKPGGKLVYSSCSIAPEENEMVINEVLKNNSNFSIQKISYKYGEAGFTKVFGENLNENLRYSQRLYPHVHDTIGFYFCLIKKKN